jgi:hypothetical protein
MKIRLQHGLPFITASLVYQGQQLTFKNVLLDTGSAGTIFPTDLVLPIGLTYEPDDEVHRIRGIGGAEFVFTKTVDVLAVGAAEVQDFQIEVGAVDYGFEIDGIIGTELLIAVGAVIDLSTLEVYAASDNKAND